MNGQRFGRLVVAETIYNYNGSNKTYCRCICDCGNTKDINASNLRRGLTRSCGCIEEESRYGRKHGKYTADQICGGFTLIEATDRRGNNNAIIWKCKCNKCGSITEQMPTNIVRNNAMSCGCEYTHPLTKDLTGRKFGFLTVESIVKRLKRKDPKYKRVMWNCVCDCGRKTVVSGDMLTSGRTTSCGCRANKSAIVSAIKEHLIEKQIKFSEEYRFDDCRNIKPLPFDFYLHDYNVAIEYDGRQHYEPVDFWGGNDGFSTRLHNDDIKNKYCDEHNIWLVRLPYYLTAEEILKIIDDLEPVTSKCSA